MNTPALAPEMRMLITHECVRLQHLYCQYADRGDVNGFTGLFCRDGSVAVPEHAAFVGEAAIGAAMQQLIETGVTNKHISTNNLIEPLSAAHAQGSCYLIVYASAAPADERGMRPLEHASTVGHYDDEFVLTDTGWKFKSRQLTRTFRRTDAIAPTASDIKVET
ncbi:nuclear transport factor 2 family protein [Terricaulis sp.]|uniref:nuclear transport factor 2 family protein n=1 Tax=Terricaulis sp. TaxID=2768686 RepID=UPI002AC7B3AE|nr:nuclear transport factor 2 family protein [Terricaulis sp.]MDZ4691721.1 nuclear transport factor 2 family protein [Terricaulis sp.]